MMIELFLVALSPSWTATRNVNLYCSAVFITCAPTERNTCKQTKRGLTTKHVCPCQPLNSSCLCGTKPQQFKLTLISRWSMSIFMLEIKEWVHHCKCRFAKSFSPFFRFENEWVIAQLMLELQSMNNFRPDNVLNYLYTIITMFLRQKDFSPSSVKCIIKNKIDLSA